ncbi:hypothetical protein E2562_012695 [Oryza meyeriana var. granulata]|uniref:non-specific serine/threonine protein kinase n=1 Tax=Oryza meyeriana var. granulata TaxID=110450 RepID=A0A6G1CGW0_9ORYZ|nr:hypothetical protein E2562_012695 [Oryza meyeriana var. granulata]
MSRGGISASLSPAAISKTYSILSGGEATLTDCSSGKATIKINTGTYYVTSIDYNDSSFWAVDANLQDDTNSSSCPLPPSDHRPFFWGIPGPHHTRELILGNGVWWVPFVNCSQAVKNNGMFVLAPLAVLIFLAQRYWTTRITIDAVEKFLRMQLMLGPTRYTYTDIIAMTSHFRDKLGHGGFGSVFKGVIFPGEVHVAIKMLANYNCNGEEFISEVSTIGSIHHVHVVRLVGFCAEEMRRALVYEYMPHGSLDKFIFSPEKSFSWDKLNEIALGIAKGINYLHEGCEMQILHFDIKPHNILLDSNFIPKIADFGLAKLYPRDNSFVTVSAARGTMKPHDRPTMSEVIEMLEGGVDDLHVPSRPFFCDDEPLPPVVDSSNFSSEPTEFS